MNVQGRHAQITAACKGPDGQTEGRSWAQAGVRSCLMTQQTHRLIAAVEFASKELNPQDAIDQEQDQAKQKDVQDERQRPYKRRHHQLHALYSHMVGCEDAVCPAAHLLISPTTSGITRSLIAVTEMWSGVCNESHLQQPAGQHCRVWRRSQCMQWFAAERSAAQLSSVAVRRSVRRFGTLLRTDMSRLKAGC